MTASATVGGREGPDGGWSWVVAAAACFNSLVLAGIFRTSGFLFVAFIDTFGVTREEAAWPMVVCISVLNLTGPFAGILGHRFGVRPVVMAGAVIGAAGVSACFFTTSLKVITVLFGGVFGVGWGFVNTLMPVIVNSYFLNLRSTANGIAYSGGCIGSVLLPILFEYLIEHFGLSGCFLLIGSIVLNVAEAGSLMRPPSWQFANKHIRNRDETVQLLTSQGQPFPNCDKELDPNSNQRKHLHDELITALSSRDLHQNTDSKISSVEFHELSYDSLNSSSMSSVCMPNSEERIKMIYDLHKAQKEFEDSLSELQNSVDDIVETSKSDDMLNKFDPCEAKPSKITNSWPARHSFSVSTKERASNKPKPLIPSSGPLKRYSFRHANSSGDIYSPDLAPVDENCIESDDVDNISKQSKEIGGCSTAGCEESAFSVIRSFATVMTSPMFYVTAITNVSFYFLFHMFLNIIVDYALDRGVPEKDTKYILFIFSFSDLFGRLCLGWITDKKFLTRSTFLMMCMFAIGLVFFMFSFATNYWSLMAVSCCYGVLLGGSMVVFPILLVEYLGMEMHAVAYGCLCFMNGFASFPRPLLIGYFRDQLGSYENMFYILGIISIAASACWILERCFLPKSIQRLGGEKGVEGQQDNP